MNEKETLTLRLEADVAQALTDVAKDKTPPVSRSALASWAIERWLKTNHPEAFQEVAL